MITSFDLQLPAAPPGGDVEIEFHIRQPQSPAVNSAGGDPRQLGLGLISMTLMPISAPAAATSPG